MFAGTNDTNDSRDCHVNVTLSSQPVRSFPENGYSTMEDYLEELLERQQRWNEPLADEPADDGYDM